MANILESTVEGKYYLFRGKPLLREGNQICYGSMDDPYMMYLMVLSEKDVTIGGVTTKVPDRVIVQILKTDTTIVGYERIVKQFDKSGLYEAFNAGLIYLDRLSRDGSSK